MKAVLQTGWGKKREWKLCDYQPPPLGWEEWVKGGGGIADQKKKKRENWITCTHFGFFFFFTSFWWIGYRHSKEREKGPAQFWFKKWFEKKNLLSRSFEIAWTPKCCPTKVKRATIFRFVFVLVKRGKPHRLRWRIVLVIRRNRFHLSCL